MKTYLVIPNTGQRIKIVAERYVLLDNKIEFESGEETKAFFFISNIVGVTVNDDAVEEDSDDRTGTDGEEFL